MVPVSTSEVWVPTPRGRLFVKCWTPLADTALPNVPIVLFHESLGCVELWRDFPEQLSLTTGRQIIAYDRLGFGQSDPHPGTLEDSFIGDEATGSFTMLSRHLRLEHFIAFGHSVGGGMAAACAAAFPERCCALITESAQAFVEDRTLDGIREVKQAFAHDDQFNRLKKYHGAKTRWVLSAWVDTWLSDSFRHWNLDASLARVCCPALAIHGKNDQYGSIRQPERFVSLPIGPSAMEILPNCGHIPHREQRDAVIDAASAFLAQQAT